MTLTDRSITGQAGQYAKCRRDGQERSRIAKHETMRVDVVVGVEAGSRAIVQAVITHEALSLGICEFLLLRGCLVRE